MPPTASQSNVGVLSLIVLPSLGSTSSGAGIIKTAGGLSSTGVGEGVGEKVASISTVSSRIASAVAVRTGVAVTVIVEATATTVVWVGKGVAVAVGTWKAGSCSVASPSPMNRAKILKDDASANMVSEPRSSLVGSSDQPVRSLK